MGKRKKSIEFFEKHQKETEALASALQKVSEKFTADTKKLDSYLVVTNENGDIEKIPAKYL
jgi:hypothetical protein